MTTSSPSRSIGASTTGAINSTPCSRVTYSPLKATAMPIAKLGVEKSSKINQVAMNRGVVSSRFLAAGKELSYASIKMTKLFLPLPLQLVATMVLLHLSNMQA
ncbi:hypothetical protein ACH5RR_021396 [Cinchona calisaya]|uniref:Uncharacterized protein n=1 Tax=Cinchona calisaya TaxID=153742 RepID=A0ABD2ZL01_9GENT